MLHKFRGAAAQVNFIRVVRWKYSILPLAFDLNAKVLKLPKMRFALAPLSIGLDMAGGA